MTRKMWWTTSIQLSFSSKLASPFRIAALSRGMDKEMLVFDLGPELVGRLAWKDD